MPCEQLSLMVSTTTRALFGICALANEVRAGASCPVFGDDWESFILC
jgi:hypothetical protein